MADSAYTFELAWRWTNPSHNVLPPEVMAQIVPLDEVAVPSGLAVRDQLNRAQVIDIRSMSTCDVDEARRWLLELPAVPAEKIVINWGLRSAVQTTWEIFARFWDDFCYPSSDDVEIYPPSGDWILLYHHRELFEWGRAVSR